MSKLIPTMLHQRFMLACQLNLRIYWSLNEYKVLHYAVTQAFSMVLSRHNDACHCGVTRSLL